jgi:hypothetical protein
MGYHIVPPGEPGNPGDIPLIVKDGGTGAWRDAKKVLRQWYLHEAHKLRDVTEKSYFGN